MVMEVFIYFFFSWIVNLARGIANQGYQIPTLDTTLLLTDL
jgi:hypothetical protein